jgi:hypothetical protein
MDPLYRLEGTKSYNARTKANSNQFNSLNAYLGIKEIKITDQDKKILKLIN